MAERKLVNQVAIVTGASRGIGRAIAETLADEGAAAVLVARNGELLETVAQGISSRGGEALPVIADVTSTADVQRMVGNVLAKYGRIDVLVNNAGVAGSSKLAVDIDDETWQRVLDGNLKSAFICSRAVLPTMLAAGYGRIVNLSSRVGLAGYVLGSEPGGSAQVDYAVAKAGVVTLTKSLAREVAPKGITVNAVAPGPIVTDMLAAVGEKEVARRATLIPVGRLGQPRDIAEAVLFLALPHSSFITGEILNVNGGTWMG